MTLLTHESAHCFELCVLFLRKPSKFRGSGVLSLVKSMERPRNSSHKRPRGSPTGATLSQARKKRVRPPKSTLVCKTLNFSNTQSHSRYVPSSAWSLKETKALKHYALLLAVVARSGAWYRGHTSSSSS